MFTPQTAEDAAQQLWYFKPSRDIKTVHLFNGLLREICGGTPDGLKLLRTVVAARPGRANARATKFVETLDLLHDPDHAEFRAASAGQRTEANVEEMRVALDAVLNQDGAFFGGLDKNRTAANGGRPVFGHGPATLTLTHWRHLTADPSDNKAGALLGGILLASTGQLAVQALRETLLDDNDTTTRLTAPLLPAPARAMPAVPPVPEATPSQLAASPVLADLQAAFENLAGHRRALGKLELLARAARLPPGSRLTARQFWQLAYERFGLICGVRGAADLADLARAGITGLTPAHLAANAQAVLAELTRQGYAQAHADGETVLALQ